MVCHGVVARGSGWGTGYEFGCGGPYERRDLAWGLKWELVVGEFVCGPCLRGWNGVAVRRIFVDLY